MVSTTSFDEFDPPACGEPGVAPLHNPNLIDGVLLRCQLEENHEGTHVVLHSPGVEMTWTGDVVQVIPRHLPVTTMESETGNRFAYRRDE